jgi:L-ascorbate metabolism protein UlaG (beta-lactamase superfamily)/nitrite reductase/ring-hydroxylating ferredoxin subunit
MNGPLVTSLGHAGLRIDAAGLSVLCDPWLSPGGAFLGSWWQFPDNSHLATPEILDADWVVVSHAHSDHLDRGLLARLPERTRVVIPRYPSPALRDAVRRTGVRHVIELDSWQRLALNDRGDWLTVIQEVSPMCHDAGVLLMAGGRSILHANDARLTLAQCRRAAIETSGQLDLMAVQMSGASWHPVCYEYPPGVVGMICAEKRLGKFKAVTRLVRQANPRIVLPYAGPPCFLDPALAEHNRQIRAPGIFPDQEQAGTWLAERLRDVTSVTMLPGDVLEVPNAGSPVGVVGDPHWQGFSYADTLDYLVDYRHRRAGELAEIYRQCPAPGGTQLETAFVQHFRRLGELSPYFLRRIDMRVRFEVQGSGGGDWDVLLRPEGASVEPADGTPPSYRFRLEGRWLLPVLTGAIGWEDLLLSLRFRAARDPDVYNDYFVGLLKHADAAALQAVEEHEVKRSDDEIIDITDGDRTWSVGRYCPHAGEDLAIGGVVSGGRLRCLSHNFDFDLATGQCLNARCDPLRIARRAQTSDASTG